MSTVYHYKPNLRDVFFNLFEVHDVAEKTLKHPSFSHLDEVTCRQMLTELYKLCETELAASYAADDREGLQFDGEGNVTLPTGLRKNIQTFRDGGWPLMGLPEHMGGVGAPPSVAWAGLEATLGSNPALTFYCFGNVIARTIDMLGTEAQKARYVQPMVEQGWGGTMVLTEPDAGSDVGAGRTSARHVEGDVWEIEGVKRFISQGDFDGVENIVHLVLARPEGGELGTKGLSMFIVPKFWVNEDGSLGERNGAFCTNVEKKMGLKSSATCEMTFGDRMPCRGLLVGGGHQGIRQMFHVIEHARMAIGVKTTATLSTAYLNALAYAKERVQGPDLAKAMNKTSPRVRIIEHPDVRRMMMLQKAWSEGMRGLYMYVSSIQDQVEMAGGHGSPEAKGLDRYNDLLLPLVKGFCSDKGYEVLAHALQSYGGSGYCQDYPIEQYIRDQKIDSLYEGTTHIQALDFFFRKVAKDGGATFRTLLGNVRESTTEGHKDLAPAREALARALGEVERIFMGMMGKVGESLYHVGLQGNRILFAVGKLVVGWRLVVHAELAAERVESAGGADAAFYAGKVASARFYCAEVLPEIGADRRIIEASSLDLMDVDEAAF
jgi:alkylation response protein AidB-like acyl-CoA dehydrogenase